VVDQQLKFIVSSEKGERLDKTLVLLLPELSRSRIQQLIKEHYVKVNQEEVEKNGLIVLTGDQIDIVIPEVANTNLVAEDIPLNVIFENADLAVINKPAGMVVHPAVGHASGTLVNAALAEFDDLDGINGELRPGIVHRLDKDTSGIIILAKNDRALAALQDQFKTRKVQKTYLALVDGAPPTPNGHIETAIARDPSHRKKMAIVSELKGRHAETDYRTIESFPHHTLIEAHPLTGRTHQIRLHMAFIKCPIVGDTVYGRVHPSVEIDRHFLHAAKLMITLPGEKEPRTYEAPLPKELESILEKLRKK
jgi:23S rRNA pseudouridine1911/1915/1917 synthase